MNIMSSIGLRPPPPRQTVVGMTVDRSRNEIKLHYIAVRKYEFSWRCLLKEIRLVTYCFVSVFNATVS
jgi:hypothetical protein